MSLDIKRLFIVLLITALILLIPLISMQFTNEVNWTVSDFMIAGLLLFVTGLLIEFTLQKTKKTNKRLLFIAFILAVFLLIWAQLAVGLF